MDSDEDYSTDDNTRKREQGEEHMANQCRKTTRTPNKGQQKSEDKLDKLIDMMQSLSAEVQQMRKEQKEYSKEIKALQKENNSLKQENDNIKKTIKVLNARMENWEREKKQNNVVIAGMDADTNDQRILKEAVTSLFRENLDIEVSIHSATRLGHKTCLVSLENKNDKIKVMENKSKLRNMKDKIYINNDLTVVERNIQRNIRQRAEDEKKNGKRVTIGYQKLVIDGKQWKWNEESGRLEPMAEIKQTSIKPKN